MKHVFNVGDLLVDRYYHCMLITEKNYVWVHYEVYREETGTIIKSQATHEEFNRLINTGYYKYYPVVKQ
jgi:hypothetical protein